MWIWNIQVNSWFWFKQDFRRLFTERLPRWVAWHMPKRVVMWAFYRVIAGYPDPDVGTRTCKPIDVIGDWCEYHGIKGV